MEDTTIEKTNADLEVFKGKKLDRTVSKLPPQETLYIGSASGFFFIGTVTEFERKIDGITDRYRESFRKTAISHENRLHGMTHECLKKKDDENAFEFAQRLIDLGEAIKREIKTADKARKRNAEFTDIRDRKVSDIYEKGIYHGIAIIVDGAENGGYWTKEEWESGIPKGDSNEE